MGLLSLQTGGHQAGDSLGLGGAPAPQSGLDALVRPLAVFLGVLLLCCVGCVWILARCFAPSAEHRTVHVSVQSPPGGYQSSEGQREAQQQLATALTKALEEAGEGK